MIAIIISICAGVVSGMILFFLQRYFKNQEKRDNAAEERKTKRDYLMLKSLRAIGELAAANAIAVKDGKTNGEMHKAMDDFTEVDKELDDFLIKNATIKNRRE